MGNSAQRDVQPVAIAERRAEAWKLRVKHLSIREIATRLGVSVGTIHGDLKAEKAELTQDALDEIEIAREALCESLGAIVQAHLPAATAADNPCNESAATCIKAIAAIAKIKGAEAPQRNELTGKDGGPLGAEVDCTPRRAAQIMRDAFGVVGPILEQPEATKPEETK